MLIAYSDPSTRRLAATSHGSGVIGLHGVPSTLHVPKWSMLSPLKKSDNVAIEPTDVAMFIAFETINREGTVP
jgi:hypothetical protein